MDQHQMESMPWSEVEENDEMQLESPITSKCNNSTMTRKEHGDSQHSQEEETNIRTNW